MVLRELIDVFSVLDAPSASGNLAADLFSSLNLPPIAVKTLQGEKGKTDVISILIPGARGKSAGGGAPTLGLLGTLGGIGARPSILGMVSDADGAVVALSAALKLARMRAQGDLLAGDVIAATHICPAAPTQPHEPVPFMGSPIGIFEQIEAEISSEMDALLSVDTTRGNRIINHTGFAISPTVKEGYILRVSEDVLGIMEIVTADSPVVFPITTQDITPYGNGIYHLNSILQPSVITDVPVIGVALTSRSAVPGCATGANAPFALESAARFCVEVAKGFGEGKCRFHDEEEFQKIRNLYGSMDHLRKRGGRRHE
jgi:hypothetical protein